MELFSCNRAAYGSPNSVRIQIWLHCPIQFRGVSVEVRHDDGRIVNGPSPGPLATWGDVIEGLRGDLAYIATYMHPRVILA
jgi:hypothetical protein